jgi:hypothetical protein
MPEQQNISLRLYRAIYSSTAQLKGNSMPGKNISRFNVFGGKIIPTYDRIVLYDADDIICIQAQPGQDLHQTGFFIT